MRLTTMQSLNSIRDLKSPNIRQLLACSINQYIYFPGGQLGPDKKFSSVDSYGQICFLHAKHSLRKPWCTKLCQRSQAAKPKSKQHSTDRHHSSVVSPRSAIRLASGNTINPKSKKKAKQQREEEGKQNAWLKVGLRLA